MSRVTVNVNGLSLVHEDSGGVSTATLPDVCLTPPTGAPAPYPNVARSRDLAGGSSLVRADGGHRIAVAGSAFARSTGGEPGSGGGVTSGTSGAEATFLSHSFDVTIEGRGACRLTDKMLHNRGNTIDCSGVLQATVAQPAGSPATHGRTAGTGQKKLLDAAAAAGKLTFGIDTNGSTLDTGYARGKRKRTFVGRYLIAYTDGPYVGTSNGSNPGLTPDEVTRLHTGGMAVFAIWEVTKYRALETGTTDAAYALGKADGAIAKQQIAWCGGKGKPVYFTCDYDITPTRWHKPVMKWLPTKDYPLCPDIVNRYDATGESAITGELIAKYFEGIGKVLHLGRIGAYGSYFTIKKLFDLGLITYGWQWTFGKNSLKHGGKIDPRAQLHQYDIYAHQDPKHDKTYPWGVQGAGALDYDRAVKADFGAW